MKSAREIEQRIQALVDDARACVCRGWGAHQKSCTKCLIREAQIEALGWAVGRHPEVVEDPSMPVGAWALR